MPLSLDTPVQYVKGVGPVRGEQLGELGVKTVEDLLLYFPRRFDLRRQCQPIGQLAPGAEATCAGTVVEVRENRRARVPYFEAAIEDDTGCVTAKWFHGGYLRQQIRPGLTLAVSGKPSLYRESLQFVNPRWQALWQGAGAKLDQDELLPVYPAGGKLTSGMIAQTIHRVLGEASQLVTEFVPRELLAARGMPPRAQAVAAMHRPEDREHWASARRRMAWEECLLMQLGIAMIRMRQVSRPAHPLPLHPEIDRRIRARFPFALTPAQDRAVAEIAADMARDRPMNRLLQGDVGSGKTVVALYAALLAVARGRQVAIMAPTEILAAQHHARIQEYLAGSRVRTELLVGGMPAVQRARLLDALSAGSVDIVVGTHALLSGEVQFANLALVVVDEQHKFGVRQRTGIRGKGYAPHYLVMTATPIPRTLAMTVFGDLDVSVISELPPGRGRTRTRVLSEKQMPQVLAEVRAKLAEGQQAYFIYPLVSASAELELKAAEDEYRELSAGALRDYPVGLIHGQMPAERKEAVMRDFAAGRIAVLVASVVVEVGLDVPAANVMVVLHAERFGLAQLHQLRGRVGRSGQDAECMLVAGSQGELASRRLEVLQATGDGFRIAEEDLRIRGPGEFFGTRQHGLPDLKVADLAEDLELMRLARTDAARIVESDPGLNAPHHQRLRQEMLKAYAGKLDLLEGA